MAKTSTKKLQPLLVLHLPKTVSLLHKKVNYCPFKLQGYRLLPMGKLQF